MSNEFNLNMILMIKSLIMTLEQVIISYQVVYIVADIFV